MTLNKTKVYNQQIISLSHKLIYKKTLLKVKEIKSIKLNFSLTPVVDTLKLADNSEVQQTVNREGLFLAQTPQMFKFSVLIKALENIVCNNMHITDEAEAVAQIGGKVKIIIGSKNNIKITVADDLQLANYYIENYNEN